MTPVGQARGRRLRARRWLYPLLLAVIAAFYLWPLGSAPGLEIVFLDVGQGDATLVRTADGRVALIDGGRSTTRLLEHLERLGVTTFDLVVATHADFDHIAGLVPVMEGFPVSNFMDNGLPHTTQTYARLIDAIEPSGARYLEGSARTLTLGDVTLTVLPPPLESGDQNGNSIGILLRYGAFEAVLPGDATADEQRVWLERYRSELDDIDIYRAAHHGSRTGDRRAFVAALAPEVVVISAGLDNSYGHPHAESLANYRAVAASLYRTDLDGSVTVLVAAGGDSYRIETGAPPIGGSSWLGSLQQRLGDLLPRP